MEKKINGKTYIMVKDENKNCDNCAFLISFTKCGLPENERAKRINECFANNYAKVWKLKL